jgi:virulence-associated protein VagC
MMNQFSSKCNHKKTARFPFFCLQKIAMLISLLLILVLLQCGESPQINFPQVETHGIIDGYVDPPDVGAMIYLQNVTIVDSVLPNTKTGYFQFKSIAYGSYKIIVKADSFGTVTSVIRLASGIYTLGSIPLSRYPAQILSISPRENSEIKFQNSTSVNDSSMEFCISFKKPVNRLTFLENFSTDPPIPYQISKETVTDYRHDLYIVIRNIELFKYPKITFTLKRGITTIYFEPLEYDYSFNYFPDTSKIDEICYRYFLSSVSPSNNSQQVNINSDVRFQFRKLMDHSSVEQALVVNPVSKYELSWLNGENGGDVLVIQFKELLSKGVNYTITIDSLAYRADSFKITYPLSLQFSTDYLRCVAYSPASKELFVPEAKVLTYSFNYPVDSSSFIKAFTIIPSLDSLQFLFLDNKKAVMIVHPDFIADTNYIVIIDTLLQTYSGEHIKSEIRHLFYTGLSDSLRVSNCIQKTFPADTVSQVECGENIIITFTGPMDRASIAKCISVTPTIPTELVWLSTSTLQIKQLQFLKSNTQYTITIDSGYTTQDQKVRGTGYKMNFKTKPLRVISYYPLTDQVNVSCDQDVQLIFSAPIDTMSLLSQCYFNPPVDSLVCLRDKEGKYYIRHARLLNDTEYNFIVSDSIADRYGIVSGNRLAIKFKTIRQ